MSHSSSNGSGSGGSKINFDLLRDLIARLRDDKSSPQDQVQLKQMLGESAEARRIYARYAVLQGLLELGAVGDSQQDGCDGLSFDFGRDDGPQIVSQHDNASSDSDAIRSPILGFLGDIMGNGFPMPGPASTFWLLFAFLPVFVGLAIVLVIAVVGIHVHVDSREGDGRQVAGQGQPIPKPLIPNPSSSPVARFARAADCVWADTANAPKLGDSLPIGRTLKLNSGLAEIVYQNGATVLLQGPAEFDLRSGTSGYLKRGKLTVTVEEPLARGFEIQTSGMKFTDLGTEFGVLVGVDDAQEVDVFRGRVVAEVERIDSKSQISDPKSTGTNPQSPIPSPLPAPLILSANEAIRVEKPQGNSPPVIVRQPVKADQFIRQMPDDYPGLVLSMRPVAYYRMERPKDAKDRTVVVDSAPGGHNGLLHLGKNNVDGSTYDPYVEGRFGNALSFRNIANHDYVIVPDYPEAKENQLSVSAWARAESRPVWANVAANWGETDDARGLGQFHFGCHKGDLELAVTSAAGSLVELREGSGSSFPLGTWQHVAFTVDGKVAHLYRNGLEVASQTCNGILATSPIHSMAIGCKTDDSGQKPTRNCFWHGRVDEVAVFHRALSVEEIKRLFQGHFQGK